MKKPTAMQRLFVAAMKANGLNATEAYITAGGSKKTAHSAGPRLTKHPWVEAELALVVAEQLVDLNLKSMDVLLELKRIGLSDVRKLFDDKGQLLDVSKLDPETAAAIASVEVQVEPSKGELDDGAPVPPVISTMKFKFWDKPKGLELLGKYFKLFTEKHEHSLTDPAAAKLTLEELRKLAK